MRFWRFIDPVALTGQQLTPVFNYELGWLSLSMAVLGCLALFPALRRMQASMTDNSRQVWLLGGAFAMGFGYWSMHWTSMLGFELPVAIDYDGPTAILALVPAIAGAAGALWALGSLQPTAGRMTLGALALGLGISGMHYTAMEALRFDGTLIYDPAAFASTLALGTGFALLALYANLIMVRRFGIGLWAGALGAILLGIAGLSVHFAGMGSALFYSTGPVLPGVFPPQPAFLIPAILLSTLLVTGSLWIGALIDTQLGRSVEALTVSELRLRSVLDVMPEGLITASIAGIVQSANQAAGRIFGYSPTEMLGMDLKHLMNGPNSAAYSESRQQQVNHPMYKTGGRMVHPVGGRRRDGRIFPIEVTVSRIETKGEPVFSCMVKDLSATWEADQRLQMLATAIDSSHDAIVMLNAQREFMYVNQAYERATGFVRADVIGHPPRNGASTPEVYAGVWATVMGRGHWEGRLESYRHDGSLLHEEGSLTAVRNAGGEITAFISVFRDITARLAEEVERQRLTAAVEHAADAIEILDTAGQILYVNLAYEKRTGYRLADIRGKRPEILTDLKPEPVAYAAMRAAVAAGNRWMGTLRSSSAAGASQVEEISVSPILDEAGRVTSFVVVKRDVTQQRQLESQLQQARKLESIGQLAAGIAHEINTPTQYVGDNIRFVQEAFTELNALLGKLSALSGGAVSAEAQALASADLEFLREEVPKALEQSADGCQRISGIVKAMKDFSHPGQDKTPVDLNRAIASTVTVASNEWKYVAEMQTDFDAQLPPVVCLPGEFNQVILNMLVNAAHAITDVVGDGGGKGTITVTTRQVDGFAEIRISDTGTGIPPEIREKIFDPFFTTKQVGKGTGQGLAIAHDVIVNKHGGTIAIESEPGKGSTFIIRLPLAPASAATARAA